MCNLVTMAWELQGGQKCVVISLQMKTVRKVSNTVLYNTSCYHETKIYQRYPHIVVRISTDVLTHILVTYVDILLDVREY